MTTVYGTQVTAFYLAAETAYAAGGPALAIAGGTLVVGDGGGSVPAISALVAANGVTHEVWRGATIDSVSVDSVNPAQLNILVEVPTSIGGVEIGPFYIYEFAILDASGNCCVVGTCNFYKAVSGGGMSSAVAWVAAIVSSVAGSVTVTPPSAGYTTMTAVIAGFNANLPNALFPITQTDSIVSGGWKHRAFGIPLASQPADATVGAEQVAIGATRAATDAEFAAGAPESGSIEAVPYPTLQQIASTRDAIWFRLDTPTTSLPNNVDTQIANYANKYANVSTGTTVNKTTGLVTIGAADAGVWLFTVSGATTGSDEYEVALIAKGSTVISQSRNASPTVNAAGQDLSTSTLISMAAGDTVNFQYLQSNSGATTGSIYARAATNFTGVRLGS